MVRKDTRIGIICRAAEDSPIGCIGVRNQVAIMGVCSVRILGIIFESSGQPVPDIDGVHRSHSACSTGQRLHCPDDSKCNYSSSDKSALLRHRQRKHGYQAKPTASKDRYMKITKNRMASSEKLNNTSIDSSSSSPSEHVTNSSCPCCVPTVSSRQAYGAIDETDIWQGDHASPQATMTKQPVESIERSLEGHVTSRFPVSFARTRLLHCPENGPLAASKHCRCHTCTLRSIPALVAHSNSTESNPVPRTRRGVKVKEVVVYKRVGYLVKESVSGHTPDKSSYHLSRAGRGLTGYSRVSSLICR
jgi:hypothetical protein